MPADEITFAPPDDIEFQQLVLKAIRGEIPVYGVVLETKSVQLRRAFPSHRPELTRTGQEIVSGMREEWKKGRSIQPWLYAKGNTYVVADDYFCLALIEQGKPETFAAQVLGEPLTNGTLQKVGPLGSAFVRNAFGLRIVPQK